MIEEGFSPVPLEEIRLPLLEQYQLSLSVLRLDQLHPLISGNKWFKLKGYLSFLKERHQCAIITFGGPYSNHIHATAAVSQLMNVKAVGLIRGERPPVLSATLREAETWGMDLHFLSRQQYKERTIPEAVLDAYREHLLVPEGGYGLPGVAGAASILAHPLPTFTHIVAACGTGTTLAGLVTAGTHSQIVGISVLKNHYSLTDEVNRLLPPEKQNAFQLVHGYHFGGYAHHTPALLDFMNDWYGSTGIPTDFVYTAKLFFGVRDLIEKSHFPAGSRILLIHSGGLQGNRSLPKGSLIF